MPFFILALGYFSTMGILYLVFSSLWKKVSHRILLILGHSIALMLSIISFITRSHIILLYLQSVLLVLAVILSVITHKGKKISKMRILYFLIFALWLINLWIIDRPRPFLPEIEIVSQAVSLVVFLVIYLKILKWVK